MDRERGSPEQRKVTTKMAKALTRAWQTGGQTAGLMAASVIAVAALCGPVVAQQKAPAAPPAAAQKAGETPSAWVKLCEKAQYQKIGADGKPQMNGDKPVLEDKQLCLTHHEQMTAAGVTIVSAAIQQLEGVERLGMMVMVPSAVGLTIPTGMRVFVYTKEQWEKVTKKEKVDEATLPSQDLRFTMCHQNGCTAENEATPALLDAMKKGAVLVALAIHVSGRPVSFEVPLNGFGGTFTGAPIDNKIYNDERGKLWETIKANQIEQMKRFQEQLQNPAAPAAGGPGPAAAAPKAAAAPAPAKK